MKKVLQLLTILVFAFTLTTSLSSCSKKTGCPSTENAHVKPGKKGNYPTKKGNSNLFPKKMRKN